jgi:hypothetical protein
MNWNRNHYMTVGFLMILCGFHFRVVESFVLTPQATKFLADQQGGFELTGSVISEQNDRVTSNAGGGFLPSYQSSNGGPNWSLASAPKPAPSGEVSQKVITPPNWMGWPMIYLGAVTALFGMTMQKNS